MDTWDIVAAIAGYVLGMLLHNGSPALKRRLALLVGAIGAASQRGENVAKKLVREQARGDVVIDSILDKVEPKGEKRVPMAKRVLGAALDLLPLGKLLRS